MSYTRKVTITKQGNGGSWTTETVTYSSSSSSSSNSSSFSSTSDCPATMKVIRNVQPAQITRPITQQVSGGGHGGNSSSSSFEQAVLDAHNRFRAKHSAPPLVLDSQISRYAQEWANNLASRNSMYHRTNGAYGENLYACYGKTNISGEEAVQSWYDEIKYYRFGQASPGNFSQVGHFTQVVWEGSRRLGVGIAKTGNNVYVVCNYDPRGNYVGQYASNVHPR